MDTSYSSGESSGEESDENNSGAQQIPNVAGKLIGIDAFRFLPDKDIAGIHLVKDVIQMKILQKQLVMYNHSPKNVFPVMWPVSLTKKNLKRLETEQFVITAKPQGTRCLFYTDSDGHQYLQNGTQNFFRLAQSFQFIPPGTILDGIVVISEGVHGETTQNSNADGKPTFFIMDATRVNQKDLTQMSILERISVVQAEIMQRRVVGIKENSIETNREVFELDIAQYKLLLHLGEHLAQGFEDRCLYLLRSIVFYPLIGTYTCQNNTGKRVLQWNMSNEQNCSFRLKVASKEGKSTGKLYVMGAKQKEVKYEASIMLTEYLKTIGGSIIECRYIDNCWNFVCVRTDRIHPNDLRTISGKLESVKYPATREMLLATLKAIYGGQEQHVIDFGSDIKSKYQGDFAGIDPLATFLEKENVHGISLVKNFTFVRDVQIRLGAFNHGPGNRFPVNWPVSLNKKTMIHLKNAGPVVVAPKPLGIRYLLYVDPKGKMFMENNSQHIFSVDSDRAPRLIPKDTILDGIMVKKIVRNGAAQNHNQETNGELSFVIMDATRVNGVDLTQNNIQDRISVVQSQIMLQRSASVQADEEVLEGHRAKRRVTDREVFGLDITKYVEVGADMGMCTSQGFKDSYEYPLRSFVFNPRVGTYSYGGRDRMYQWDESTEVECCFRLKITVDGSHSWLKLFVYVQNDKEKLFYKHLSNTIDMTDELKKSDGCITDYRYLIDNSWSFVRVRTDRKRPDDLRWISGKLESLKKSVKLDEVFATLGANAEVPMELGE